MQIVIVNFLSLFCQYEITLLAVYDVRQIIWPGGLCLTRGPILNIKERVWRETWQGKLRW
jgi:hypothetical protein